MMQEKIMQMRRSGTGPAFLKNCLVIIGVGVGLSGCVSNRAHEQTLAELEQVRRAAAQQAEADNQRLLDQASHIRALTAEVGESHLKIQQIRDRLTVKLVDRILFASGSAAIKPDGMRALEQIITVLKSVADKQIRIDGHTDDVPIGPGLKNRFSSNWELSSARATSVARYLIVEGGIAPELLTAAGHAYTHPVAGNDSEEGRSQNRRIEILLYPKDLKSIAAEIER